MTTETIDMQKTSFGSILDTNKKEMSRIESYKNEKISTTPRNLAFAGLSVAGLFMAGIFAFQIISGILAIVTVVGVGVGGFLGLRWLKKMDPVIKQKTKNAQLKFMMDEARKNAIYQLDNKVISNAQRLQDARGARNKMGASIENLRRKINPANVGKPAHTQKTAVVNRLQEAYEQVIINLEKAAVANTAFEEKVKEYKDMEAFALVAGEAMAMFENNGGNQLEDMLSLAAFDHIDSEFSTALISIENSARDMATDGE